MTLAGTPATAGGRIHLLIALTAFLAVAAGTLLAGYALRSGLSWRGWSSPLMAISALPILDLVLPGRHGFGVHFYGGLLERIFLAAELPWYLLAALRLTPGQPSRAHAPADTGPAAASPAGSLIPGTSCMP